MISLKNDLFNNLIHQAMNCFIIVLFDRNSLQWYNRMCIYHLTMKLKRYLCKNRIEKKMNIFLII